MTCIRCRIVALALIALGTSQAAAQTGESSRDSLLAARTPLPLEQFAALHGLTLIPSRALPSRSPLRFTRDADLLRRGADRAEVVADTMLVVPPVPAFQRTLCPMPVFGRDSAAVPPMPVSVPSTPVPVGGRLMGCVNPLGPAR